VALKHRKMNFSNLILESRKTSHP